VQNSSTLKQLFIPCGPKDQTPVESRPDVLLFTSQPFTQPTAVCGTLCGCVPLCAVCVSVGVKGNRARRHSPGPKKLLWTRTTITSTQTHHTTTHKPPNTSLTTFQRRSAVLIQEREQTRTCAHTRRRQSHAHTHTHTHAPKRRVITHAHTTHPNPHHTRTNTLPCRKKHSVYAQTRQHNTHHHRANQCNLFCIE